MGGAARVLKSNLISWIGDFGLFFCYAFLGACKRGAKGAPGGAFVIKGKIVHYFVF